MKKIINLNILMVVFSFSCMGQSATPEFLTTFYITDAKNNKDSVKIGYDPAAEYGISDGDFGEAVLDEDIFPFKSSMDFRVGGYFAKSKIFVEKRECDVNKKKSGIRGTLYFYSKKLSPYHDLGYPVFEK